MSTQHLVVEVKYPDLQQEAKVKTHAPGVGADIRPYFSAPSASAKVLSFQVVTVTVSQTGVVTERIPVHTGELRINGSTAKLTMHNRPTEGEECILPMFLIRSQKEGGQELPESLEDEPEVEADD